MELIRLNSKHLSALNKCALKNKTVITDHEFTNTQFIIGLKEGFDFQQVMICKLDGVRALTRFVGRFNEETYRLLDSLCAICASFSPEIVSHSFIIDEALQYNFLECFSQSRLGGYITSKSMNVDKIDIEIEYPS